MIEYPILDKSFYTQDDVVEMSKALLGKYLVSNINNERTVGKIVETEAYKGAEDKACHAYLNRNTNRTKVMFEEGGVAYIYLCYGIHHLFNIVTSKKGTPYAILVRAVEPIDGIPIMLERRKFNKLKYTLTNGPGKLSKAMGFDKKDSGIALINDSIYIEDRGVDISEKDIISSPRVGIDYAEEHALLPWRFRVKDSKWTSKAK